MSHPFTKRALGSLRRLFRRRRAPRPSEQEWLRLILLVRRLQHHQLAFVQRFDEIRALTGVLGSFRSDFGALHEQLSAARESAGELERGLAERLDKLDGLPDADEERAALDRRIAELEAVSARLETLAAQAPTEMPFATDVGAVLGQMKELAARFEAVVEAEREAGGQEELARLYERMQELAESVAVAPRESAGEPAMADELVEHLARFAQGIERFEAAASALQPGETAEQTLQALARLERLADRLEQAPAALPELPPEAFTSGEEAAALSRELDELRATLGCEQEARRRLDAELESLRAQLRSSELARVELETRHAGELTQVADHAQRQIQRVEDDVKKKKRGLAELTQQNIRLQGEVDRMKQELARAASASPASVEPSAPLPRGGGGALSKLMVVEGEGKKDGKE